MNERGELTMSTLIPWIIAILVLVLMFFIYGIITGKVGGGLDFLKNLLSFGR